MIQLVNDFCLHYKLTPREVDLMIILVERTTVTADIAVFLNISPHTTNHHLQRIFEKMNAVSKADVLHRFIHYAAKDIPGLRASV